MGVGGTGGGGGGRGVKKSEGLNFKVILKLSV